MTRQMLPVVPVRVVFDKQPLFRAVRLVVVSVLVMLPRPVEPAISALHTVYRSQRPALSTALVTPVLRLAPQPIRQFRVHRVAVAVRLRLEPVEPVEPAFVVQVEPAVALRSTLLVTPEPVVLAATALSSSSR